MKNFKLKLSTLFFIFMLLYSCSEGELQPDQTTQNQTSDPIADDDTNDDDNNTNDDDTNDNNTSNVVSYSESVSGILQANCTSCHGANNPSGGLSLHTYTTAKNGTKNSSVLSRIRDVNNPMPQGGLMSEENIKAIEDWAAGDYQE